jgi:protein-S-isoprenylcysteine O-methyltransferase Ste14
VANGRSFWARWRVRTGYLLAALYLWLASPTIKSIAVGGAVAALGLIVRGLAAGHLHKQQEVTMSGPYAWTRNPLYFGSALLVAGFAVGSHSTWAAILIVGYYSAFYPAVMKREEQELRANFGPAFDEYAKRVPLFWPRPPRTKLEAPKSKRLFSWAQYKRNREYNALLGYLVGLALLWARMLYAVK